MLTTNTKGIVTDQRYNIEKTIVEICEIILTEDLCDNDAKVNCIRDLLSRKEYIIL